MKRTIAYVIALLVIILTGSPAIRTARAEGVPRDKPRVIIDSGHTGNSYGATGMSGRREVEYNDNLVAQLSDALVRAGFTPILTRRPDQEIALESRAEIANSNDAILMLSIHHDSAQMVHLEPVVSNGVQTYRTRKPISGFSIFVSRKNRQFGNSLLLGRLLAHEMQKIGRKASLHHAEPIPGEGWTLLGAELGIYRCDDLILLKTTAIPAVLFEVGVIVDTTDEAYVSHFENQQAIVTAIVSAIGQFRDSISMPH